MFQSSACRIASLCAAGFLAQPAFSEPLALEQLIEGRVQDLVMNQAFLPSDAQAPAHAEFNGTLLLGGGEMQMRPELADREVMGLDAPEAPPLLSAALVSRLKKKPGRREFQRGILSVAEDGSYRVEAAGRQGSGILRSMGQANCFIVLPEDCGSLEPGAAVQVQPFAALC